MSEASDALRGEEVARLRRAQIWLITAFSTLGAAVVFVAAAVVDGRFGPIGSVGVLLLVAVPLFALFVRERRAPSVRCPARWTSRGLGVGLPAASAVGIVVATSATAAGWSPWWAALPAGSVALIAVVVPVVLASRALRYPLSAALGALDVDVRVPLRAAASRLPGWLARDDVTLTRDSLIIMVRPDSKWAFAERIPLEDIRDVRTRSVTTTDGPWFTAEDGPVLWPPAGEVVVISLRNGSKVLPTYHPAGFAEVLRARVRRLAAIAESGG